MADRRIIHLRGGVATVGRAIPFPSELVLHQAIASHPDVLPHDDFGIGPLVAVANELDLGSGPIDLLCVDASGELAIVEFKRGTENADVRKVVAQLLDYASSLWRTDLSQLEERARSCAPGFVGTLAEHVEAGLGGSGTSFDLTAFEQGLRRRLESGDFVFVYVARDLDERTSRIMTYLGEGARLRMFAVEVDYFASPDGDSQALVPRAAFVPSHVTAPEPSRRSVHPLSAQPPDVQALVLAVDRVAASRGWAILDAPTGRAYRPADGDSSLGIYWGSSRGVEFNLTSIREILGDGPADSFIATLEEFSGQRVTATAWPHLPIELFGADPHRAIRDVITPYFDARDRAGHNAAPG